jgi:hypothetical protein
MPWGKHKGEPISNVPSTYLCWTIEETDIGEPYLTEIRDEIALRLGLEPPVTISRLSPPADLAREVAEMVAAGFRARSARLHPDHQGGDVRAMQKLNAARAWCRDAGLLAR